MRIISLVPSITELLCDLGLEKNLVGITKFCIHPDSVFHNVQKVGGTKNLRLDLIRSLSPDLIIANKEENVKEQIEELSAEFNLLLTDVNTFDEAIEMIHTIGAMTNTKECADRMVSEVQEAFSSLIHSGTKKRVIYLIWRDPFMAAGTNTFIHSMIEKIGLVNCISAERYPELSVREMQEFNPDYILLSTEPYPFKEEHKKEFMPLSENKIIVVDGEMFSWYGSRLKLAPVYFKQLLKELH